MSKAMDLLQAPPTEEEVASAISFLSKAPMPREAMVVRRLAFERDTLKGTIIRLLRGDFTDEEFQNLCHNLDESDFEKFCDGCDAYQMKLFGKCRTGWRDHGSSEHIPIGGGT